MPHWFFILFFFALGACIGSFLNVVVWRLPRNQSLISPPSRCPVCLTGLAWFDNIPVFGWLMLRGRCRYCHNPISIRYPIVEFITGALFVLFYVMLFIEQQGPRPPALASPDGPRLWFERTLAQHWMIYLLYAFTISCLFAASLIDIEAFWIPQSIPLVMAGVGLLYHAMLDRPDLPGATLLNPRGISSLVAAGGTIGLLIALLLLWRKILPRSFEQGYPELEIEKNPPLPEPPGPFQRVCIRLIDAYRSKLTNQQRQLMENRRREADAREKEDARIAELESAKQPKPQVKEFTPADIRRETRKEMLFLLFPLGGAILAVVLAKRIPAIGNAWSELMRNHHLNGLMGALLGALAGGFMVWLARILGGLIAGREAMGMGDVDLMFGAGAILGAGPVAIAFFIAPFFGLISVLPKLFGGRGRELPYGPYLSMGTAVVMLYYWPIADWFGPGFTALMRLLAQRLGLS